MHAYTFIPIDLQKIDSITNQILHERNIASEFVIQLIAIEDQTVMASSKKLDKSSFSHSFPALSPGFRKQKSLEIDFNQPFSEIIKRMGLMLLGSSFFHHRLIGFQIPIPNFQTEN